MSLNLNSLHGKESRDPKDELESGKRDAYPWRVHVVSGFDGWSPGSTKHGNYPDDPLDYRQ
jgi:hypothetical protein